MKSNDVVFDLEVAFHEIQPCADDMLFLSVSAVFMCSRFFKTRMREGWKAFALDPWKIPLEGQ